MSLPDLCAAVWGLSALRVAVESDLLAALAAGEQNGDRLARAAQLAPDVTEGVLDVLEAHGFVVRAGDTLRLSEEGAELAKRSHWLRADLAATFGQTQAFVIGARRSDLGGGWDHTDADVLRAYGVLSETMVSRSLPKIVQAIPGMAALERPGATMLDVGAGAAGGLIALCRKFPGLRGVGLEPLKAARLEAHAAITAAGLGSRIEIRPIRAEELDERRIYDAAFVAAAHMSDASLRVGLARVREALVPGGTIIFGAWRPSGDARAVAASRLRWRCWGGGPRSPADLARLATDAGLVDVTHVREASPAGDLSQMFARAPAP